MALAPGSLPANEGDPISVVSMAKAIEVAFMQHWESDVGGTPPKYNKQMQLLFVAVAEGVINHLKTTPMRVTITTDSPPPSITLTGTLKIIS